MTEPINIVPFPHSGNEEWIESYHQACLNELDEATIDAYLRILRQFTEWVAKRPGHAEHFQPDQLTMTVVEGYLSRLKEQGYSQGVRQGVVSAHVEWDEQGPSPKIGADDHRVNAVASH